MVDTPRVERLSAADPTRQLTRLVTMAHTQPAETTEHGRTRSGRHLYAYFDVAVVIVVLACTNLIAHFTTAWASIFTVPIAAMVLLSMMRRRGLRWSELGLSPRHWRRGSLYALTAVGVVIAVMAIGAALPMTRPFFLADRYATISGALIASMIVIPLQTVIPEELAFRGVLHGTLGRIYGARGVFAAGSLLFGLWHIASSLGLTASNKGLTDVLGAGPLGQVGGILIAVVVTAGAGVVFTWLRHRSGSLLAPIALHWSINGAGALGGAVLWQATFG